MDVLTATIFVSLLLVCGGLALFVWRLKGGDFEHGDRLSLLPLDDEGDRDAEEADAAAPRSEEPEKDQSTPNLRRGGSA